MSDTHNTSFSHVLGATLGWFLYPGLFAVAYPAGINEAISTLWGADVGDTQWFNKDCGQLSRAETKHRIAKLTATQLRKHIYAGLTVEHELTHVRQAIFSPVGL